MQKSKRSGRGTKTDDNQKAHFKYHARNSRPRGATPDAGHYAEVAAEGRCRYGSY
jgi:hypothetical protein